jgi:hypothetical protein
VNDSVLPEQTRDDTDEGWQEDLPDDNTRRLLEERPPHHERAD